MDSYCLEELKMVGINWEINEMPNKIVVTKNTNKSNKNITIIPPQQPVNIESLQGIITPIDNFSQLFATINDFKHPLRKFAKNTILPEINVKSGGLLIITDAPSSEDDINGCLLSGNTGELMEKMLNAIGLNKAMISLTPLLFWSTPGGRGALPEELNLARPFVNKLIALLKPDVIMTLGATAAQEIANIKLPKNHGKIIIVNSVPIMPIYHPKYLLLKPGAKKEVWDALQKLQKLLKN